MKIPNWLRKLQPKKVGNYGKWCGAYNTHDSEEDAVPIDGGDAACMAHDFALRECKTEDERARVDAALWRGWKKFKPNTLYGKIYRSCILLLFKNKYHSE